MQQPRFFLLLALAVFLLSLKVQAKPPVEVIAFQAQQAQVKQKLRALGKLEAIESVALAFNVSDKLTAIHIKSGQLVNKGQLLFELEQRQQQARLQQAIELENESLSQYRRVKKAIRKTSVTESLVEEKYRLWQTAMAETKIQQHLLEQRKLFAPFSGTLGLFNLSSGALIENGTPLVTLFNHKTMKLKLLLPNKAISQIQTGLPIKIHTDAYPKKTFHGTISAISSVLENNSQMLPVEADILNPEGLLKANMLVAVDIILPVKQQLQIPNSALLMLGDKEFVYRLTETENGLYKAHKFPVEVGKIGYQNSEILTGLSAGDLIVSQGVMRVNSKISIKVKALQNDTSQADLLKPSR